MTKTCLLSVIFQLCLAPSAFAFHEIFDRSQEKIAAYFGKPIHAYPSAPSSSEPSSTLTYSNAGIRKILPELPEKSLFMINFEYGLAKSVQLIPMQDEVPFHMNVDDFKKFFAYVLAFDADRFEYQASPLPYHANEGFQDFFVCMGAGVLLQYVEYRNGILGLELVYRTACE